MSPLSIISAVAITIFFLSWVWENLPRQKKKHFENMVEEVNRAGNTVVIHNDETGGCEWTAKIYLKASMDFPALVLRCGFSKLSAMEKAYSAWKLGAAAPKRKPFTEIYSPPEKI